MLEEFEYLELQKLQQLITCGFCGCLTAPEICQSCSLPRCYSCQLNTSCRKCRKRKAEQIVSKSVTDVIEAYKVFDELLSKDAQQGKDNASVSGIVEQNFLADCDVSEDKDDLTVCSTETIVDDARLTQRALLASTSPAQSIEATNDKDVDVHTSEGSNFQIECGGVSTFPPSNEVLEIAEQLIASSSSSSGVEESVVLLDAAESYANITFGVRRIPTEINSENLQGVEDSIASWGEQILHDGRMIKRMLEESTASRRIPESQPPVLLHESPTNNAHQVESNIDEHCHAAPVLEAVSSDFVESTEPASANSTDAVEAPNKLLYRGVPIVNSIGLPLLAKNCLLSCQERGWIELLSSRNNVPDNDLLRILVVETVARKSGKRLCARTLTYINSLMTGCWIVEVSWLFDSLQAGRLLFPETPTYTAREVAEFLEQYEMGGCDLDCVFNSPATYRLLSRDIHGRTNLLEGFEISLIEEAEPPTDPAYLSGVDIRVLVFRCGGGEVRSLRWPTSAAGVYSSLREENTCFDVDEDTDSRYPLRIAIDMRNPVLTSEIKSKIISHNSEISSRQRFSDVLAVVSVEWLFDAICNQRVSKDFRLFAL